jgi:hypothetical protein
MMALLLRKRLWVAALGLAQQEARIQRQSAQLS